ncbi:MAG: TolC family protein [Bdellovibrionota bacterium]
MYRVLIAAFTVIIVLVSSTPSFAGPVTEIYARIRTHTLENAPDIRSAKATLGQKQAGLYTSWTRWLPRADVQLSQSRIQDFSILTGGSLGSATPFTPTEVSLSRWALNINVPIYRRSVHAGLLQAYAEKSFFEENLNIKTSEVQWKLRSLFGAYLFQTYKFLSLGKSTEFAETSLKEAKLRFELGERTKVDVLRAEANLSSLVAKALSAEQESTAALTAMFEYAGLDRQDLKISSEDAFQDAINEFSNIEELFKILNQYIADGNIAGMGERIARLSPLYRNYLSNESLADSRARSATVQEWPELILQGSINKQAQTWGEAFSPDNRSRSISVVLSVPIFSGGSLFSTTKEQNRMNEVSRIKTDSDIMHLKSELEEDITRIMAMKKALQSHTLNLAKNEELVRLSQNSYRLGKTTLLELQAAQNDLLDAKVTLAETKINLSVLLRKFAWNLGVQTE